MFAKKKQQSYNAVSVIKDQIDLNKIQIRPNIDEAQQKLDKSKNIIIPSPRKENSQNSQIEQTNTINNKYPQIALKSRNFMQIQGSNNLPPLHAKLQIDPLTSKQRQIVPTIQQQSNKQRIPTKFSYKSRHKTGLTRKLNRDLSNDYSEHHHSRLQSNSSFVKEQNILFNKENQNDYLNQNYNQKSIKNCISPNKNIAHLHLHDELELRQIEKLQSLFKQPSQFLQKQAYNMQIEIDKIAQQQQESGRQLQFQNKIIGLRQNQRQNDNQNRFKRDLLNLNSNQTHEATSGDQDYRNELKMDTILNENNYELLLEKLQKQRLRQNARSNLDNIVNSGNVHSRNNSQDQRKEPKSADINNILQSQQGRFSQRKPNLQNHISSHNTSMVQYENAQEILHPEKYNHINNYNQVQPIQKQILDENLPISILNSEKDIGCDNNFAWERIFLASRQKIYKNQSSLALEMQKVDDMFNRNDIAMMDYLQINENLMTLGVHEKLNSIKKEQ